MKDLSRLPPSEARKLLALAAVTLKARQRPPRVVAEIRTNGASISQDELPTLIREVARRLLELRRLTGGEPGARDLGPVVFDLSDLRAPSQVSTACSDLLWCGAG
jgi:glycerol-3-phosphate O-acyltransferase